MRMTTIEYMLVETVDEQSQLYVGDVKTAADMGTDWMDQFDEQEKDAVRHGIIDSYTLLMAIKSISEEVAE